MGGFTQNLSSLQRTTGTRHGYPGDQFQQREALLPESRLAAARRRRDVLGSLIAVALFLLVATTMFGRAALYAHIVVDVLAIGFAGLMIRRNRLAAQRAEVVTQLPTPTIVAPLDEAMYEDGTVVDLSTARQFRKIS